MKRLTLVRHGHAAWKEWKSTDFDRPLTRRGNTEAEGLGKHLLAQQLVPDLLITSTAQRAKQTAEILAREFALATNAIKHEESIYLCPPQQLLRIVQSIGPRIGHLMLVGHNPGISEFARLLAPNAGMSELQTAQACTLVFEEPAWADVAYGRAKDAHIESRPARLLGMWM